MIKLEGTDLKVNRIAFGLWGLAGPPFWDETPRREAVALLRSAAEAGINFFDTAPVYGMGNGETLLAETFPGKLKDEIVITTKVGLRWRDTSRESIYHDLSPESLRWELEQSLKRLNRECIDLYQVHWPDPDTPLEATFTELSKMQAEGKIRHIGVSNFSVEMLMETQKYAKIATIQNRFNLLDRNAAASLLPYCKKHKLGTLIYSPLAAGLLTGKYNVDSTFNDWRSASFADQFAQNKREKALRFIEKLRELSKETKLTIAQLSLIWVLNWPGVSVALLGIRKMDHLLSSVNLENLAKDGLALFEDINSLGLE